MTRDSKSCSVVEQTRPGAALSAVEQTCPGAAQAVMDRHVQGGQGGQLEQKRPGGSTGCMLYCRIEHIFKSLLAFLINGMEFQAFLSSS
jgi:hypothetical protein